MKPKNIHHEDTKGTKKSEAGLGKDKSFPGVLRAFVVHALMGR